jgi:hypothetical protein
MTLSIKTFCNYAECHVDEFCVLFVNILSMAMLSVAMLSVAMLSVAMLSVTMLSVAMLTVAMLSVVAPIQLMQLGNFDIQSVTNYSV